MAGWFSRDVGSTGPGRQWIGLEQGVSRVTSLCLEGKTVGLRN